MVCVLAHRGQVDKAGNIYALHPMAVAAAGADLDQIVLGLLHDVIEGTGETLKNLKDSHGLPYRLLESLDAISKRVGETRKEYLYRVAQNGLATLVKLNDIDNNLNFDRLKLLSESEAVRLNIKYNEDKKTLYQYVTERNLREATINEHT